MSPSTSAPTALAATTPSTPVNPTLTSNPTRLTSPDGRFSCWVETDHPLMVYSAISTDEAATGHIASEEGKRYKVKIKVPQTDANDPFPDYAAMIVIDGSIRRGLLSDRAEGHLIVTLDCARDGNDWRSLVFHKPVLREDVAPLPEHEANRLSTIEVTVRQVRLRPAILPTQTSTGSRIAAKPVGDVCERTKKGHVASLTTLGEAVAVQVSSTDIREYATGSAGISAYQFTLSYMPLPVLRAFGFAPRPPNPPQGSSQNAAARVPSGGVDADDQEDEKGGEADDEDAKSDSSDDPLALNGRFNEDDSDSDIDEAVLHEEAVLRKRLEVLTAYKKNKESKKRSREVFLDTKDKRRKVDRKRDGKKR